jgi:hypothetical protein
LHPDGFFYEWIGGTEVLEIPAAPSWLLEWIAEASPKKEAQTQRNQGEKTSKFLAEDMVEEGKRNHTLFQIAGRLRWCGLDEDAITRELQTINQRRCNPPLPESEVFGIARSIGRYPKGIIDRANHNEGSVLSSADVEKFLTELERPEYLALLDAEIGDQEGGQSFGYAFNDSGNSQRLFDIWGEGMLFCPSGAGWLIWNGERWEGEAGHKAFSYAYCVSRALYAQVEGMAGLGKTASSEQKEVLQKQENTGEKINE